MTPLRAVNGLDVVETDDGLIVYQEVTDRVHHLNPTAAVIFQLCDGTLEIEEIAREVANLFSLPEPPLRETEECVTHLLGERLIHLA